MERRGCVATRCLGRHCVRRDHPVPALARLCRSIYRCGRRLRNEALDGTAIETFGSDCGDFIRFLRMESETSYVPARISGALLRSCHLFVLQSLKGGRDDINGHLHRLRRIVHGTLRRQCIHRSPFRLVSVRAPACRHGTLATSSLRGLLTCHPRHSASGRYELVFLLKYFAKLTFSSLGGLQVSSICAFKSKHECVSLYQAGARGEDVIPLLPITRGVLTVIDRKQERKLFFQRFPDGDGFGEAVRRVYVGTKLPPRARTASRATQRAFTAAVYLRGKLPVRAIDGVLKRHFVSAARVCTQIAGDGVTGRVRPLVNDRRAEMLHGTLQLYPSEAPGGSDPVVKVWRPW